MRWPSSRSRAGRRVSAATMATVTAAIPPNPIERRNAWGNTSRELMAAATVSPENSTVRPAVRMVVVMASDGSRPASSSSRNRLTTNSA